MFKLTGGMEGSIKSVLNSNKIQFESSISINHFISFDFSLGLQDTPCGQGLICITIRSNM